MEYRVDDDGAAHRAAEDADVTLTGVHAAQIWGAYTETVLAAEEDEIIDPNVLDQTLNEEHETNELELELDSDQIMPNRWERRRRPDEVIEVEIDPLTGLAPAEDAPLVDRELVIEENAPRLVSGFWGKTETATVDLRSDRLLSPACVFPVTEEQRYITDGRYRIGPARFYLGAGEQFVTSDGDPFNGIYEVGPYEPVQQIDPETRMPSDPARITIDRTPELPCLIPTESEDDEVDRVELLE